MVFIFVFLFEYIVCTFIYDVYNIYIYILLTGAWGSGYIDRHFVRLLNDMFPAGWMQDFQHEHPSDYTVMLNNFRRAKETFYARDIKQNKQTSDDPSIKGFDKQQSHNIKLPAEFILFCEDKLEEYNKMALLKNNEKTYESVSDYVEDRDFLGTKGYDVDIYIMRIYFISLHLFLFLLLLLITYVCI